MSETISGRSALWIAIVAAIVATAVWASVAMAAGGSTSSGASASTPQTYSDGPHAMFAASGGTHAAGDCPNMGGDNGGGGSSTTPSTTPSAPTTPSAQDGSSNPSL